MRINLCWCHSPIKNFSAKCCCASHMNQPHVNGESCWQINLLSPFKFHTKRGWLVCKYIAIFSMYYWVLLLSIIILPMLNQNRERGLALKLKIFSYFLFHIKVIPQYVVPLVLFWNFASPKPEVTRVNHESGAHLLYSFTDEFSILLAPDSAEANHPGKNK